MGYDYIFINNTKKEYFYMKVIDPFEDNQAVLLYMKESRDCDISVRGEESEYVFNDEIYIGWKNFVLWSRDVEENNFGELNIVKELWISFLRVKTGKGYEGWEDIKLGDEEESQISYEEYVKMYKKIEEDAKKEFELYLKLKEKYEKVK